MRRLILMSYLLNKTCDKNIKQFYRQLSAIRFKNPRIKELESLITSSKNRSKNYILIEDKCNVLPKLNSENMSLLLETEVKEVLKWRFKDKCCALVEVKDNNYLINKKIRKRFGLESKESFTNEMRFISCNSCTKMLSKLVNKDQNNSNYGLIQDLSSRESVSNYLNLNYLRENFNSNEEILRYLLSDEDFSDLDYKIRYYITNHLESFISGINPVFKDYHILPFGSTIAGLGTPDSDLDVVVIPKKRLEEREILKDYLRNIGDNANLKASLFYSHISLIFNARIPIIKFDFNYAPIIIDLSLEMASNHKHHGFYISLFLYYCLQLNPEVRDLILLLKIWAKQKNILKPKYWPTRGPIYNGFISFHLISLVIYFLQREGLVPSMTYFLNSNQTFQKSDKQMNIFEMLTHFFEFMVTFPFDLEGISIFNANTFPNRDFSPIYVEQPFDTLNMCQNITRPNFERILKITNNSLEIMQNKGFSLEIFETKFDKSFQNKRSFIKIDDFFVD